jgi:hypothetical protein
MPFASGISHRGLIIEDSQYPYFLATGIVEADVGKAVSLDTAAYTVKLAADGDVIHGVLVQWENRVVEGYLVGTVAVSGGFAFTRTSGGTAITPGDLLCGGGAGQVRKAVTGDATVIKTHNRCVASFANGTALEGVLL